MNTIALMLWLRAALALLCCAGCGERASAGSSPAPDAGPLLSLPPSSPSPSGIPSEAKTTTPEPPSVCPAAVRVVPRALAAEWPVRIGERVRLSCRVLRAVDAATYLVQSDGVPFAVLAEPGSPPCTPSTSTFVVMGSTRVHDRGRVRLPELLVDACGR